ncbi:Na(+)-translocating NADH-quinone reductase subunit C, partial [Gammaproteobacteria bacterium]|nr:Na(+)-translocating NADH-quinone reductase subunit C [Gammaproteobacteria bacterium]
MKESVSRTLLVAFTICLVCSLVVSYTAVGLRDLQNENKLNDERKKILQSANMFNSSLSIESQFEQLEIKYVDFSSGKVLDTYKD